MGVCGCGPQLYRSPPEQAFRGPGAEQLRTLPERAPSAQHRIISAREQAGRALGRRCNGRQAGGGATGPAARAGQAVNLCPNRIHKYREHKPCTARLCPLRTPDQI
jgi:hypothetical protein